MWNIFECDYIAKNAFSEMHVIDWIITGGKDISIDSIGHFWKMRGYQISEQTYKQVDNQPQDNAIIEFVSDKRILK